MVRYLIRHFNLMVLTLLVLSLFSFALIYLFPGDPLQNLTGVAPDNPMYQGMASQFQISGNWFEQYTKYMQHLFSGEWGQNFASGAPLYDEISQTLPASIELCAYALIFSMLVGIPLGFMSGLKHHKLTDYGILAVGVAGYSIPVFWLALLFILVFCLQLGWLPLSGRIDLLFDIPHQTGFILIDILLSDIDDKASAYSSALKHLILPTLSIAIMTTTVVLRITRRSVIDVMDSEYIKSAFTKGLTLWQVILRHGIRNALLPILPMLAMQFTALLTNAMIVEVVFSWPGIGNWLIQAIYQQDYPAIRMGMLIVATLVVMFTMIIDVCIRLIDPTKDRMVHGAN